MDFLDPKKTRRNTIQLFIGYVLVTIMLLLTTTILIYYSYGFNVNREGDLVQRGLVFVSSQPSGAEVHVNGKHVKNTNAKLNLTTGNYKLEIKRAGYHDWGRNISVEGGDVRHYVYPLLFPTKLNTETVKSYETAPALTSQSPDRRWLLALTNVDIATFEVFDLGKNQEQVGQPTEFSVPAEMLTVSTVPAHWEIVEWSNNNRHVLLKRYFTADGQEKFEYILADRQRPEGSYNLSRELGVTPAELTLQDKKPNKYYLYDGVTKELSSASLDEPTPVVEIEHVLAYKTHGADTVLYVTTDEVEEAMAVVKFRQSGKDYTVRRLPVSEVYLLDVARFDGNWYIVLGSQADNRVLIYENPAEAPQTKIAPGALFSLRLNKPTQVSFSANAQFIAAQNGTAFHVYDIDNNEAYRYAAPYPIDTPQTKALWMDTNRLTYASDGKQIVFDYDNINRRKLVGASSTFLSAFDQDFRYLYSFTPTDTGGLALSATPLRTAGDL